MMPDVKRGNAAHLHQCVVHDFSALVSYLVKSTTFHVVHCVRHCSKSLAFGLISLATF